MVSRMILNLRKWRNENEVEPVAPRRSSRIPPAIGDRISIPRAGTGAERSARPDQVRITSQHVDNALDTGDDFIMMNLKDDVPLRIVPPKV
jgi:hypothetical protein